MPAAGADNPWLALPARLPEIDRGDRRRGHGCRASRATTRRSRCRTTSPSGDLHLLRGRAGRGGLRRQRRRDHRDASWRRSPDTASTSRRRWPSWRAASASRRGSPSDSSPAMQSSLQGVTTYTVSSHDLHAWPELYFDGVGWLRFEPTPGRGDRPRLLDAGRRRRPADPRERGDARPVLDVDAGQRRPERPDEQGVDAGCRRRLGHIHEPAADRAGLAARDPAAGRVSRRASSAP